MARASDALVAGQQRRRATVSGSATGSTSHAATIVLIIGARPIRWPSSGEKILVTP